MPIRIELDAVSLSALLVVGLKPQYIGRKLRGDKELSFYMYNHDPEDVDFAYESYGFMSPNDFYDAIGADFIITSYGIVNIKNVGEFMAIKDDLKKCYFVVADKSDFEQTSKIDDVQDFIETTIDDAVRASHKLAVRFKNFVDSIFF